MTYDTPELLLVGAAENLVLGFPLTDSGAVGCKQDNIISSESDVTELW
jgi:hypothetical protein